MHISTGWDDLWKQMQHLIRSTPTFSGALGVVFQADNITDLIQSLLGAVLFHGLTPPCARPRVLRYADIHPFLRLRPDGLRTPRLRQPLFWPANCRH